MSKGKKGGSFSDFLAELKQEDNTSVSKPVGTKLERQYFLIVSEGEKTEPLYFEYFKKKLPKNLLNSIELIGDGSNTINVVNRAIVERDKRAANPLMPDFDEAWAVFDKDDFGAVRVNEAIQLAARNAVEVGFSNQSFELWYVLHFQYLDADLDRSQYLKILSNCLQTNYEKNSEQIVELIFSKGDVDFAIKNAKKLSLLHEGVMSPYNAPYTSIYKLVEKLREYCEL